MSPCSHNIQIQTHLQFFRCSIWCNLFKQACLVLSQHSTWHLKIKLWRNPSSQLPCPTSKVKLLILNFRWPVLDVHFSARSCSLRILVAKDGHYRHVLPRRFDRRVATYKDNFIRSRLRCMAFLVPGSAWGDWSLYTDSPLRAFESETGASCPKIAAKPPPNRRKTLQGKSL